METVLPALGQILLGAVPTFVIVVILHIYLKAVFFKPLEHIIEQRRAATEGARNDAKASLDRAEQRAAEYEAALRAARNQLYQEHEQRRRQWREQEASRVAEARRAADASVKQARTQLEAQAEEAKRNLEADSRELADQITRTVLAGAAR